MDESCNPHTPASAFCDTTSVLILNATNYRPIEGWPARMNQSTPESRSLFHYTTGDGLISIVKNQSLHATHSDFLNDPSECRLIKELLTPVFQKELAELIPKLIERRVLSEKLLEDMGRQVYATESENIFRCLVTATNNTSPFFISSFCLHEPGSEQHEHGLLSQWRAYARGGFAIELDELKLDELHRKEQQKHAYMAIMTNTVAYKKHKERADPKRFVGVAKAVMREVAADKNKDISDLTGKQELDDYWRPFVESAPFLKDGSFQEENEYRLVAVCFGPAVKETGADRPRKKIEFRSRSNNSVVPYVDLFAELPQQLPIKSVIVGPHSNQELQRHAVTLFTGRFGVDAPVRLSRIPFRD